MSSDTRRVGAVGDGVSPFDDEFIRCPFDHLKAVRAAGSAVQADDLPLYLVAGHRECLEVANDPSRFRNGRQGQAAAFEAIGNVPTDPAVLAKLGQRPAALTPVLHYADGPLHARQRRLINKWFTPRRVERDWAGRIERIADELIDGFVDRGHVDFVSEFAAPLPTMVITDIIGVERERAPDVKRWSDHLATVLGRRLTEDEWHHYADSYLEMTTLVQELLDDRMRHPGDDLASDITRHLQDESQPDRLTENEARSMLTQLLVGGNETATQIMAYTTETFAREPDLQQRLRENPALIPTAVEEALRYVSPALGMYRNVREDVELDGQTIPADSAVALMYGSANHDESVFPDPERFDLDRPNLNQHLAFGQGVHFCLGAGLARVELRIGFERVLVRLGNIRTPAHYTRADHSKSFMLRDLGELPLEFDPPSLES